ncbi:MAG: aminotransferase class I/II-fold pyridoxal phosphate-dependent enzyme [Pirellulaceae bacterium]|nr:aminotransferase class I/II-fold pyridoxal phosphate-dependent enzyme [Pirellulaceae bacterium]
MNSVNAENDALRLAIAGGEPVFPDGPPTWPPADDDIRRVLQAVWADGSWGRYLGPHRTALEEELARQFQTPYVVAVCSGTAAVELALRGLRIGPGDEVILAGYDFPGNFRAIEAVGATPVLVDISPKTWAFEVESLDAAHGPQVRAILVSHLHGGLAPMRDICVWAAQRNVAVVEDACQAPGANVQGRPAGCWGDAGVLSFGGSKLLTAGRGGAVLTRDAQVRQRIQVHSQRGNEAFPLSELQAAVLLPQLKKLPAHNQARRAAVDRLLEQLCDIRGLNSVQRDPGRGEASFYKLAWLYDPNACRGRSRADFLAAVRAEGVALDEGFRGFVLRSTRRCRIAGTLDASRAAAENTVLLHHPVLLHPPESIDSVAQAIRKVVSAFQRN